MKNQFLLYSIRLQNEIHMQKCVTALRSCSILEQLKSSMCMVIFPIGTQTQSFVYKLRLSVDCIKTNKYQHN